MTLYGGVDTTARIQQTPPNSALLWGNVSVSNPAIQAAALRAQDGADYMRSLGLDYQANAMQSDANEMIGNLHGTGINKFVNVSRGVPTFGGAMYTSDRLTTAANAGSMQMGQLDSHPQPQPYQLRAVEQQPIYLPYGGGGNTSFDGKVSIDLTGLLGQEQMERSNAMLAAILANQKPPSEPLNYKPYNDILQRFPEATAQLPQENYGIHRRPAATAYDTDLNEALKAPVKAPELIAQRPTMAPFAPESPKLAPPMVQQPQMDPNGAGGQPYPMQQPNVVAQAPQQAYGQPYPPQYAPQRPYSPTGAPETDVMYYAQPMMNPQYRQAYAQQQQMAQYAQQMAMQGPPQAPTPYMVPGSQHGWNGFAQRAAMLNPNNRAAYMNAWKQGMINQQQQYNQGAANWRAAMQSATTMNDAGMRESGSNAREMQRLVGSVLQDIMKQPTAENVTTQGMKIVDAYPPGPQRDQALAAAAQAGLDLWNFRNVPQSPKAVSMEQGREDRHDTSVQKYNQNEIMNPLRVEAAKLRNTRLESTNPAYIRRANALADIADINAKIAETYAEPMKQAQLKGKQQQLQGEVFKETNSALAKANAINQQYENAYKNYLMAGAKDKAGALQKITGAFGPIDADTGLPRDVLDARKTSRELTAEVAKMAASPELANPPTPAPMQQQMQKMQPQKQQMAVPPPPLTKEELAHQLAADVNSKKISQEEAIRRLKEYR